MVGYFEPLLRVVVLTWLIGMIGVEVTVVILINSMCA